MRALVTGGAGFIGAAVASELLEQGNDVVVVDDLSTGNRAAVPSGADLRELDVGDRDGIDAVLQERQVDVCLHFAGLIAAGESMQLPERYFSNNVAATITLLDALVAAGVPRFVFSSSAAVYGEPISTPIDESHPLETVNPYGESKLLVERVLTWLSRLGHLRFATLRYFNAAGAARGRPEQHRPETHLIPLALSVAAGERDVLDLYGDDYPTRDGTCVRDYIHVSDLADAHVLAIGALDEHDALACNLGSGTGWTNAEVIQAVRDVTGRDVPVRVCARRPGDPAALVASNDKARSVLGWAPAHSSLTEIVGDAWAAVLGAGAPS